MSSAPARGQPDLPTVHVDAETIPDPILEVSTIRALEKERICPEPDIHIVQVRASADNPATAILTKDDGGGDLGKSRSSPWPCVWRGKRGLTSRSR